MPLSKPYRSMWSRLPACLRTSGDRGARVVRTTPNPNSYWVVKDRFLAGEYPERQHGRRGAAQDQGVSGSRDHLVHRPDPVATEMFPYTEPAQGERRSSINGSRSSTTKCRPIPGRWPRFSTRSTRRWCRRSAKFTCIARAGWGARARSSPAGCNATGAVPSEALRELRGTTGAPRNAPAGCGRSPNRAGAGGVGQGLGQASRADRDGVAWKRRSLLSAHSLRGVAGMLLLVRSSLHPLSYKPLSS